MNIDKQLISNIVCHGERKGLSHDETAQAIMDICRGSHDRCCEVEVIPAPRPTIENLAKVAEFLGWLAELHEAGDLHLIACDEELGENFGKIREIYPAVLAAVRTIDE